MPVFVGPGSAPAGGFEGKSDRVGFNTATSDPGSAVLGDMYVQTVGAGATLRLYDGSEWQDACRRFSASGGDTEETVGGIKRHVFTGPGNFVVGAGTDNVDILVVAGGGGGGRSTGNGQAAGGGGGGFRLASGIPMVAGTYAVTVGNGGAGNVNPGGDGADSSIATTGPAISATGGGGGGGYDPSTGYTPGDQVDLVAEIVIVVKLQVMKRWWK